MFLIAASFQATTPTVYSCVVICWPGCKIIKDPRIKSKFQVLINSLLTIKRLPIFQANDTIGRLF